MKIKKAFKYKNSVIKMTKYHKLKKKRLKLLPTKKLKSLKKTTLQKPPNRGLV